VVADSQHRPSCHRRVAQRIALSGACEPPRPFARSSVTLGGCVMTASRASLIRRLLRRMLAATVPVDGVYWVDTSHARRRADVASRARTVRQFISKVDEERPPARLANWRCARSDDT
jgi:hypothetical protein